MNFKVLYNTKYSNNRTPEEDREIKFCKNEFNLIERPRVT